MASRRSEPPFEFLETASKQSLSSFELSRLNHANNLRREIAILVDEWVEEVASAMLARWLLNRRRLPRHANSSRSKSIQHDDRIAVALRATLSQRGCT